MTRVFCFLLVPVALFGWFVYAYGAEVGATSITPALPYCSDAVHWPALPNGTVMVCRPDDSFQAKVTELRDRLLRVEGILYEICQRNPLLAGCGYFRH